MNHWTKLLLLGLIGLAIALPGFWSNFNHPAVLPIATESATIDETTSPEEVPAHDVNHPVIETPVETAPAPYATPYATPAPSPVSGYPSEVFKCAGGVSRVNFSFDGGAGSHSIQPILDTLKKHGVIGTFFLTGKWAEANPSWVKLAALEGHEIFNHTYDHAPRNSSHPGLTNYTDEEIRVELRQADAVISELIGRTTKPYFRPPYGDRNARVLAAAWSEGYRSIYWTVDALDWREFDTDPAKRETNDSVYSRIMTRLSAGTIYLMHIGDNITGNILDRVLTDIKARGYSIVSLVSCLR